MSEASIISLSANEKKGTDSNKRVNVSFSPHQLLECECLPCPSCCRDDPSCPVHWRTRPAHAYKSVLGIRIHMFLSLLDPDPDPLVRGMNPDPALDPSIIKQKIVRKL